VSVEPPPDPDPGSDAEQPTRQKAGRFREAARKADRSEGLQLALRRMRSVLPGDAHFGDPLSLGGARHAERAGRTLIEFTGDRPGVTREVGFAGLQLWQAMLERVGAGSGETEIVVAFTDLVDFSRWAVRAGDDEVLRVLRRVTLAWEKPVIARGGTVVKRLGDGMMAAFADPERAFDAILEGRSRLSEISADGWKPRMRAGFHVGTPRRVGGDFIGVSVNTAARLCERAKADEILVSGQLLERLDPKRVAVQRKWLGKRLKGVPAGLTIYSVERR
jgi:adenylate cyclase